MIWLLSVASNFRRRKVTTLNCFWPLPVCEGKITEKWNGYLKIKQNTKTLFYGRPRGNDAETEPSCSESKKLRSAWGYGFGRFCFRALVFETLLSEDSFQWIASFRSTDTFLQFMRILEKWRWRIHVRAPLPSRYVRGSLIWPWYGLLNQIELVRESELSSTLCKDFCCCSSWLAQALIAFQHFLARSTASYQKTVLHFDYNKAPTKQINVRRLSTCKIAVCFSVLILIG